MYERSDEARWEDSLYDRLGYVERNSRKQTERIAELEAEIAVRPAKPLMGEARSRLLVAMDNSAHVDDAIDKWNELKKRVKILKEIILRQEMAKLCWCDKCRKLRGDIRECKRNLEEDLNTRIAVKELQTPSTGIKRAVDVNEDNGNEGGMG